MNKITFLLSKGEKMENNYEIILKGLYLAQIIQDEMEYCLDKNYNNDETWTELTSETREQAFINCVNEFKNMSAKEIEEFFGDKYNYIKASLNKLIDNR